MTNVMKALLLSTGVGLGVSGCDGNDAPTFRLVGTTHEIMEGVVAPPAEVIWTSVSTVVDADGVHENVPQNDAEWEVVEHAAVALAESTNLLLLEGRAREGGWTAHLDDLVTAALAVREAAVDQSSEAVFETGEQVYDACTACHEEYIIEE